MIRYQGDCNAVSPCLISALTVGKLLAKGCQGILEYVRDTKMKVPELEKIPVVKDFLDVFPEELLGLSLDRDTTNIYSSLSYDFVGAKGTKGSIAGSFR